MIPKGMMENFGEQDIQHAAEIIVHKISSCLKHQIGFVFLNFSTYFIIPSFLISCFHL